VLEEFRKAASERRQAAMTAPPPALQPFEGLLLKALLEHEQVRREVLPRLKARASLDQFSASKIFEAMMALIETTPEFTYADLAARLEPREQALLERAAFADEGCDESSAMELAHACLQKLEDADHERLRAAIRTRIREAEQNGDLKAALQLTEELRRMDRP